MTYARGRAAMGLAAGLEGIGRLLSDRDEDQRRRELEDLRLQQFALDRGGDLGPAPAPTKEVAAGPSEPLSGVAAMLKQGAESAPVDESRFADLGGGRAHIVRPDVTARETAKGEHIADFAQRDRRFAALSSLSHIPEASARAHVYGDIPLAQAMPPRPARAAQPPRPTVDQAMDMLRDRPGYARWDANQSQYVWLKPYEQVYAEALEMASGRPMRPGQSQELLPTAQSIMVDPPGAPRSDLSAIGRVAAGGPTAAAPRATPSTAPALPDAPQGGAPSLIPPPAGASPRGGPIARGAPTAQQGAPARPATQNVAATREAARARAVALQAEGKSRDEILQILNREGFTVTR